MPAQKNTLNKKKIEEAVRIILREIDPDPGRDDLSETPARVARMYEEIFSGANQNPEKLLKTFVAKDYDEIIIVRDIPLYSMCEHHLMPFIGKAHVAYIPKDGRVTGLSKLVRVVHAFAKRLQVQERLTQQIAEALMNSLKPQGVMVIVEAEHLCMSMRGVRESGTRTVTSAVFGVFRTSNATRQEAINLLKKRDAS